MAGVPAPAGRPGTGGCLVTCQVTRTAALSRGAAATTTRAPYRNRSPDETGRVRRRHVVP